MQRIEIKNGPDRAFYLLYLVLVMLVLATFRDYGYSCDEVMHGRWYGQAVLRFFSSFATDVSSLQYKNFYLYGGFFDVCAELLVALSPLEPVNARHLANAIAGMLAVWGCWKTARLLGGPATGFWAALFLVVCAPFYGHMFMNGKDIPFAAGYIWALFFLMRVADELPDPSRKTRLLLALSIGLTLGVRIGGLLLVAYLLLFCFFDLSRTLVRKDVHSALKRCRKLLFVLMTILLPAYLLMLAFWPAAFLNPILAPLRAFQEANRFDIDLKLLWNGMTVLSKDVPWNYLPVLFAVKLPEVLVIILAGALPWAGVTVFLKVKERDAGAASKVGLLLLAALFPPVWAVLNKATLYDNARHFLFILPPLACLAGWGWVALLGWERWKSRMIPAALQGLLLVSLAFSTVNMAKLHPYEYVYLNSFAGGMPGGAQKFETDYWFTSYREAAAKMVEHAKAEAKRINVPFNNAYFSVSAVGQYDILAEILPDNFTVLPYRIDVKTDYLVATTRWQSNLKWRDYPIVATVERQGMLFAVVKASPELARFVPQE